MGNFLVLPLISDECFCSGNNLEILPDLPAEDNNSIKLLPPPQQLFNKENNHKPTEAPVEEGSGALGLPPQSCKKANNSGSVKAHKQIEARVEQGCGALLLPHQLFKKANDSELVEPHQVTEARVEECTGTLLLPHQLFKKANNYDVVETHVLLPHEFFKDRYGLESNHPRAIRGQ